MIIGLGSFGTIVANGDGTVTKRVIKGDYIDIYREWECMSMLTGHSHIVNLLETVKYADGYYGFIMEQYECNLAETLPHMDDEIKINYFAFQICDGLQYCHSKGIAHRDLKPDNILVRNNRVAIADFGRAKQMVGRLHTKQVTTLSYVCPEMVYNIQNRFEYYQGGLAMYDKQCDLWSLGCILFELHTKQYRFPPLSSFKEHYIKYFRPFKDLASNPNDSLLVSLSKQLLRIIPRNRLDIAHAKKLLQNELWEMARVPKKSKGSDSE
jgi:serine/threonine protein kinase